MSDTRRHPPVPVSRPGATPDAEEAPTGVIGRVTGEWPPPENAQQKPAGDAGTTDPAPGALPEAGQSPAGRDPQDATDRLAAPEPWAASAPLGAPTPGTADTASGMSSGMSSGMAGDAAAPHDGQRTPHDGQRTPYDKQPLPVRQPRRPGMAGPRRGAGTAPAASGTEGFDYFSAARGDAPARPQDAPPAAPFAPPSPGRPETRPGGHPQAAWSQADSMASPRSALGPRDVPAAEPDEGGAPTGGWDAWRRRRPEGGSPQALDETGPIERIGGGPPPVPAWVPAPAEMLPAVDPFGAHLSRQPAQAGYAGWEAPDEEPEPAPRPKPPREPYLDNVKFILIALVATGHSLVPTLAADSSRAAYVYIYVFHMPLFTIISGYLSRNFWNSNAKTNKLVDTFLVPYVIVEVGYAVLRVALGHKLSITITDPAWLNWYLLALLFWRLSTPVWKRMRYPAVIAVVVYMFAGFSELSGDFSMDRFFGLMPFFVIGLVIKPGLFDFLKRRWVMALSVLVLAGAAVTAVYLVKTYSIKLGPFYYKNSYKDLHLIWWKGMAMRAALLCAALAMSAAVMSLIPRKETWFSDLGTRTLYCYLLHGVPVLIAKEMGWLSVPWLYGPLGVAAIASACFALAIVLCMPFTRTVFKWLLEPRLTWLYRRPREPVQQS
ncbi:acyltransferase family protein [Microbispora sp. NPDC049125]|uniref:acyltransferase family protein n=1 Tax=Microbispora sp. NPDC049125 TaxID=3154929 RepID=UPI0034666739